MFRQCRHWHSYSLHHLSISWKTLRLHMDTYLYTILNFEMFFVSETIYCLYFTTDQEVCRFFISHCKKLRWKFLVIYNWKLKIHQFNYTILSQLTLSSDLLSMGLYFFSDSIQSRRRRLPSTDPYILNGNEEELAYTGPRNICMQGTSVSHHGKTNTLLSRSTYLARRKSHSY